MFHARSSAAALSVLFVLFSSVGALNAQTQPIASQMRPIEYTISLPSPQTQMVEMTMLIRDVDRPTLEVALPVWRPGRYALIDPVGTIRGVGANAVNGDSLPIEKIDKTTWRITTGDASEVEVQYRIYANSLGDRTRHVDDTHAFLSGSMVFFYVPDRKADEILVHVDAPADWKVATGLEPHGSDPRVRISPNYHVLIDSPFEIGVHEVLTFEVGGKPHEIVIWGDADYAADTLKSDFANIVEEQAAVFGGMPYDRYVFLLHVGANAGGGTEHLNSTIMQTSRASFESDEAYQRFLGLVSHEMFHTWNVKQLRPAGINPYDYAKENYTKLLWVSEGTTSYYDDITLARIGAITPEDYLDTMSGTIDTLRNRPGAAIQSLEESSFDAWVKYNRPTPDSVNSTVSFYNGGAMASLLLDAEIRNRTANRSSLDTVMRRLYERFPLSGTGFTPEDMIAAFDQISNSSFDPFFASYIRGTEPYPLEASVGVFGLELVFEPESDEEADNAVPEKAYAGLSVSDREGSLVVQSVLSDGPAYSAGVLYDDEIVAVNGKKLSAVQFGEEIGKLEPDDSMTLHLFRYGRLRTIEFSLGGKPDGRWKLRRIENPTEAQQEAYESWLGQSWPQ